MDLQQMKKKSSRNVDYTRNNIDKFESEPWRNSKCNRKKNNFYPRKTYPKNSSEKVLLLTKQMYKILIGLGLWIY